MTRTLTKSSRLALVLFVLAGCARTASAQSLDDGVGLEVVYTADLAANVAGGVDQGVRYLDNIDLALTLETDPLVGWPGATIFLYGLGNQGGSISEIAGDAQGVSNIEAPTSWRLYEAWIEQVLPGDRVSILAGLYDVNTEFDVIWTGSLFMNSSHGIGPDFSQSGMNGPSIFPVTSLAIRARGSISNRLIFKAAILDGVPGDPEKPTGTHIKFGDDDGILMAGEVVLLLGGDDEWKTEPSRFRLVSRTDVEFFDARFAIGAWKYTGKFVELRDPRILALTAPSTDNRGVYALAEWNVLREPGDAAQGLSAFGRYGIANDRINRFASYAGLGLVYTGLLPGRDHDQAGLAVASARNGDPYLESQVVFGELDRTETVIEATYLASVTSWLSVQADLQHVINPGTNPAVSNALVPAVRLQIIP
ncbi:MAG: carbohydrate porin [Rhodothermales bacterium]|nr:carbohydrate porin [Rhodothermales bacterium]